MAASNVSFYSVWGKASISLSSHAPPASKLRVAGQQRRPPGVLARVTDVSVCGLSLGPAYHMRNRKMEISQRPCFKHLSTPPQFPLPSFGPLLFLLMTASFLPKATHPCGLPL